MRPVQTRRPVAFGTCDQFLCVNELHPNTEVTPRLGIFGVVWARVVVTRRAGDMRHWNRNSGNQGQRERKQMAKGGKTRTSTSGKLGLTKIAAAVVALL